MTTPKNPSEMTNAELNEAAWLASYHAEAHARGCPYCRQKQCTEGRGLCDWLEVLEAEQEERAAQASIEAEQAAERRNEEFLGGYGFIIGG